MLRPFKSSRLSQRQWHWVQILKHFTIQRTRLRVIKYLTVPKAYLKSKVRTARIKRRDLIANETIEQVLEPTGEQGRVIYETLFSIGSQKQYQLSLHITSIQTLISLTITNYKLTFPHGSHGPLSVSTKFKEF